jgi:hypothetical protein
MTDACSFWYGEANASFVATDTLTTKELWPIAQAFGVVGRTVLNSLLQRNIL